MWSDLAQLDILEVIRLMWSLKSIRIGLSWLKRVLQGGYP
jgi:hypothetical protein